MKRLLKAILWIVCYGGASWFGIKTKLGFDILNQDNWAFLFDKSVHAVWPADMAPKKQVCKVLLIFIVVGILGLAIVLKQKKRRIPLVRGELPTTGVAFRPNPVASQGKMAPAVPVATSNPVTEQQRPQTSVLSDAIRQINDIANAFDVSTFPHVKLENTFTQFVVSDDSNALLLKIFPQSGVWNLQENDNPEQCVWTLSGDDKQYYLKDIIQSTSTLKRLEPEAEATSVVVLVGGSVNNPTTVRQYLEKNNIRIVTLNGDIPEIQSWKELLEEFYQPKQTEENNETNNNTQNM